MTYLLLYLAITIVGYIIGSRLKKIGKAPTWVGKVMTAVIVILIFIMGTRIGNNEQILQSLDTIGLIAFVFTLIIMFFTCLGFTIARRLFGFDRYGIRHGGGKKLSHGKGKNGSGTVAATEKSEATAGQAVTVEDETDMTPEKKESPVNTLTLLIVAFVVIGILAGYFIMPDSFMVHTGNLLTLALCMLLILIGMDIGIEGTIAQNFKSAGWRIIAFPFISILSMMVGAVFAAIVLPIGVQDALCIGSGLGWYSLAPAMLADYSTKVSAISFMHNVFREIIGILLVPLVAKKVGYIESFSPSGCTSMDVSLPVVERSTSSDVAVYSFICGAILSASVPILVSIFMNI